MLMEISNQAERVAALLERAGKALGHVRGLRSGDRVFTPLMASAEFSQGQAPSRNVVFNVPADADFWAYRLCIYPYCKIIDPVNGTPPDVTYRSTSLAGESSSPGAIDAGDFFTGFDTLVDGTFAFLWEGKELQNNDIPFSAAYSAGIGKWGVYPLNELAAASGWAGSSGTPGGMVFDVPWFIPRGKALTLRLTPSYLGVRTIVETINRVIDDVDTPTEIIRQHKYKILAVLEGEKRVNAFR